jgi:hypothetical protein
VTEQDDPRPPGRVHRMAGFAPAGARVRAVCACGHATTSRVDEAAALRALRDAHPFTAAVCALCGTDYDDPTEATLHPRTDWERLRRVLDIITDPTTGEQFYACAGGPRACYDGADQRQVHLDRAAFEGLGFEPPRPRLQVVHNPDSPA